MPHEEIRKHFNSSPHDSPKDPLQNFSSMISTYTGLCILRKMKRQLGLEAMLDYIDMYLKVIESNNPKLKSAVHMALTSVSVERIYHEACGKNEGKDNQP